MSAPEHDIIFADAGLNAKTAAVRTAAETTADFIVTPMKKETGAVAGPIRINSPGIWFQVEGNFAGKAVYGRPAKKPNKISFSRLHDGSG
jgi:hypothetical protein